MQSATTPLDATKCNRLDLIITLINTIIYEQVVSYTACYLLKKCKMCKNKSQLLDALLAILCMKTWLVYPS